MKKYLKKCIHCQAEFKGYNACLCSPKCAEEYQEYLKTLDI